MKDSERRTAASWRLTRRRICVLAILFIALLSVILGVVKHRRARQVLLPLNVSLWYWNQPFRLSRSEAGAWRAMGVKCLFVRAVSIKYKQGRLVTDLPEIWYTDSAGLDVHLVIHMDAHLAAALRALGAPSASTEMAGIVRSEIVRASSAGIRVIGMQFDFDCPTSMLVRYADLVSRVRENSHGQPLIWSVTALPTWFKNRDISKLANSVDFIVPQFYEAGIPTSRAEFRTIGEPDRAAAEFSEVTRSGVPFYAGLPSYGHALVYNGAGRVLGMYHDQGPRELARDPAFRVVYAGGVTASGQRCTEDRWQGEDVVELIRTVADRDGYGKGFDVVYDLPTPRLLAIDLAMIRRAREANCRGVIFFRCPEPDQVEALQQPTIAALLAGNRLAPHVHVEERDLEPDAPVKPAPVGTIRTLMPRAVSFTVTNDGNANTLIAPGSVTLTVSLKTTGLEQVDPGDFEEMGSFIALPGTANVSLSGSLTPCSLARADTLVLKCSGLAAGQKMVIGPVVFSGSGRPTLRIDWTATEPGGFHSVSGTCSFGKYPAEPSRPSANQ